MRIHINDFALDGIKFFCGVVICFLLLLDSSSEAQVWKPDYDSARVKFNRGEIEATTAWLEEFIPKFKVAPDIDTNAYYEMVHLLGRCYLKQGFNKNAEEMFNEDIERLSKEKKLNPKSTYAASLKYLGKLKYDLKKYPEAESYFYEALRVQSKLNELKKNQHIKILENLYTISDANKNYIKCDSLISEVYRMKKDFYGANSLEISYTLYYKGYTCWKMARYSEAEPFLLQALEIKKNKVGELNRDYIKTLNRLGDVYKDQGRYSDLERIYKSIATLSGSLYGAKSLEYCAALNELSDLYRTLSRFTEAEPICLQVLQIIEDTIGQNNLHYTNGLIEISTLYKDMNRFQEAEIYLQSAISIYEIIVGEYHESYLKALVHLASLYRTIGRTADAEPLYGKALKIYKNTLGTNSMAYADLLNDYALYFDEMGHYEQAELHYKKSLEITEALKGNKDPNYASTLDNFATHFMLTGHIEQAEPIFVEAYKIRKEKLGSKHPLVAYSLNNVANLYESTGRTNEAKDMYLEALRIIQEVYGTENFTYANAIDNLADISEKEGNHEEAEKYLRESMRIIKKLFGETHVYYIAALNNLALIQIQQKNSTEAEQLYKLNIEKTKSAVGEEHPTYALALSNLADLYESKERYKEAEDLYEKALTIRKDKLGVNHRQYTVTLTHLAGLYAATNDFEKADVLWENALNNYLREIKLFFPSMSEKEKQLFYRTIRAEFEQFNSYALLRAPSNPAIATYLYNYQLETKALILNSSNKVRQKIMSSKDTSLVNTYKKWQQQKEILSKLYSLSKEEIAKEKINKDSIEREANDMEKKLSIKSQLFKNSNDTITYNWKHVQKKLKDGEAAIEMIRFKKFDFKQSGRSTDSVYYLAVIITKETKKYPELVVLNNGNELERKYLNYYKNVIKFKIEDEYTYVKYWKNISEKLTGIKKVYFSPDGVYNQLNLNTIKNLSTNKFVLEEEDIQVVTNTKDLVTQYAIKNSKRQIVMFGKPDYTNDGSLPVVATTSTSTTSPNYSAILTPLPGTEREITMISNMLRENKWMVRTSLNTEANEKNIKQVNNPKVLHIATHGFFEKDVTISSSKTIKSSVSKNPLLRSGLMMAGASVTLYNTKNGMLKIDKSDKTYEDGILTAYEAMNMSLDSTDLVILSACETGLGDVENGEGVYGLQRAFIIAGAESIILSLWKVDDATTQKLMTMFYNEWLKTGNKRASFRSAQNLIRNEFPDPYYWGAFIMVGE